MTARDKYCVYRRGEADLTLFASLSVAVFAVALLPIEFEKVDKIPQGFPRLLNLRRPGAIIVVFLDDLLVKLSLVPANRQDTSTILCWCLDQGGPGSVQLQRSYRKAEGKLLGSSWKTERKLEKSHRKAI